MLQTLFSVGGFSLGSYGVVVTLAILIGLGVAYHLASSEKEYRQHLIDVVLFAVIGAIIGARVWQVFFYEWDYYSLHLAEIFMIWHGGMAIQGALVGAFIRGMGRAMGYGRFCSDHNPSALAQTAEGYPLFNLYCALFTGTVRTRIFTTGWRTLSIQLGFSTME